MLKTLKLVRGAVAEKDLVPVLTHFHIYDRRIQGGNGRLTIDSSLPELKFNATVPADKFLKAIDACQGEPFMNLTDVNLIIKRDKFRVQLPLADHTSFPLVTPPKVSPVLLSIEFLETLAALRPFVGEDASRPWLCSILFRDGYAYATTNPVIARVPWKGQDMVVPVWAVDELLRINQPPIKIHIEDNAITFYYKHDTWLRTTLVNNDWPDVEQFFVKRKKPKKIPVGLKQAVERILPFCPDNRLPEIILGKEGVSTADGAMSAAVEAKVPAGRWHADNLLLVLNNATHMDLDSWPDACYWIGNNIEGVAMGLRQ